MAKAEANLKALKAKSEDTKYLFRAAFLQVYPPDGYDPLNKTLNGASPISLIEYSNYLLTPLTRFTSFFGISNRKLNGKQSAVNILKNQVGWQSGVSTSRKVFNVAKSPLVLILNLIQIVPKLLVNIIKLFTEFLPVVAEVACQRWLSNRKKEYVALQLESKELASSDLFKIAGMKSLKYFFSMLRFVGTAITSPVTGVRRGWILGNKFFPSKNEKNLFGPTIESEKSSEAIVAGRILGIVLASFSALISITVYTLAFPFAAKLFVAKALPYIATHSPALIAKAAGALKNILSPALSKAWKFIDDLARPIVETIGLEISPAAALISAGTATVITVLGNAATTASQEAKNLWGKKPSSRKGSFSNSPKKEHAVPLNVEAQRGLDLDLKDDNDTLTLSRQDDSSKQEEQNKNEISQDKEVEIHEQPKPGSPNMTEKAAIKLDPEVPVARNTNFIMRKLAAIGELFTGCFSPEPENKRTNVSDQPPLVTIYPTDSQGFIRAPSTGDPKKYVSYRPNASNFLTQTNASTKADEKHQEKKEALQNSKYMRSNNG